MRTTLTAFLGKHGATNESQTKNQLIIIIIFCICLATSCFPEDFYAAQKSTENAAEMSVAWFYVLLKDHLS